MEGESCTSSTTCIAHHHTTDLHWGQQREGGVEEESAEERSERPVRAGGISSIPCAAALHRRSASDPRHCLLACDGSLACQPLRGMRRGEDEREALRERTLRGVQEVRGEGVTRWVAGGGWRVEGGGQRLQRQDGRVTGQIRGKSAKARPTGSPGARGQRLSPSVSLSLSARPLLTTIPPSLGPPHRRLCVARSVTGSRSGWRG